MMKMQRLCFITQHLYKNSSLNYWKGALSICDIYIYIYGRNLLNFIYTFCHWVRYALMYMHMDEEIHSSFGLDIPYVPAKIMLFIIILTFKLACFVLNQLAPKSYKALFSCFHISKYSRGLNRYNIGLYYPWPPNYNWFNSVPYIADSEKLWEVPTGPWSEWQITQREACGGLAQ